MMKCTDLRKYYFFGFLFLPLIAFGHHTFGYIYNTSQTTEIDGQVVAVQWANPHITFTMRTGAGDIWEIESNSPGGMERRMVSQQVIGIGNRFRLAGFPARDGSNGMHASNILLADGREIVLRPGSDPYWTGVEN